VERARPAESEVGLGFEVALRSQEEGAEEGDKPAGWAASAVREARGSA
jgi:hypothetical protein